MLAGCVSSGDSIFLSAAEIAVLLASFASLILLAADPNLMIISGGIGRSVRASGLNPEPPAR